jgi:DNA-binding transcriptional regulator YiaG
LIYTLGIEVNLLDFDPNYPKNHQDLGQQIRKTRMEKGLMIKELAEQIGVTEDAVINWEIRGVRPEARNLDRLRKYLFLPTHLL